MSNHAPLASRNDPAGACLVFLGVRGLQPWPMSRYHQGPTQSCPMGAYSSGRGLTEPAPLGAHGFQPRTPLTVHLRLSTSGVSLSKPPQPTPDAKGAGVPERKFGSEALAASAKLRKSSIECLSAASFEAAAEGPLKRRDGSSCKSTLNPLPGLGFSTHGTTLFTGEPPLTSILVQIKKTYLQGDVHQARELRAVLYLEHYEEIE